METWTTEPLDNLVQSIFVDGRWADELFSGYQLFPYVDQSKRTRDKLAEKSLGKKLLEKVLPKANLSALLDALGHAVTGLHLVKNKSTTSLVDECFRVFEEHREAKQTLVDKVASVQLAQAKDGLMFHYVQQKHYPVSRPGVGGYLPTLQSRIDSVDRKFIALAGTLCSVEAMKRLAGVQLANALDGSGCRWVICDFPPFVMEHPAFQDAIVMLDLDDSVLDELEVDLPFAKDIGWYPYVRVYGHCRRVFSNRYQHPAIEFSWMEYRLPLNPAQEISKIMKAYEGPVYSRDAGFNVARERLSELLLFVDALRIMGRSVNLKPSQLRPELRRAIDDALQRLSAGSIQARALLPDPLP